MNVCIVLKLCDPILMYLWREQINFTYVENFWTRVKDVSVIYSLLIILNIRKQMCVEMSTPMLFLFLS